MYRLTIKKQEASQKPEMYDMAKKNDKRLIGKSKHEFASPPPHPECTHARRLRAACGGHVNQERTRFRPTTTK